MALVKYGGGITDMRGSIAGNTFARNRFGNYVRARTKPINPQSGLQTDVRSSLSNLTTYWSQTLSTVQRAAWGVFAANVIMKNKLGEDVYLTGMNHFIRANVQNLRAGLAVIEAGPVIFELPEADPTFAATVSEATQQISFVFDDAADWCSEDNARLFLEMGQPQNPQRNFFNGPWKYEGVLSGNSGVPIVSPQIAPVAMPVAEGQRIWFYARIERADGRLSQPFRCDCFCGA